MASSALFDNLAVRATLLALGGSVVTLSYIAIQRRVDYLERQNQSTVADQITNLLVRDIEMLEHLVRTHGGLFRASVLVVDPDTDELTLEIATHGYRDGEKAVTWKPGVGPPGRAWHLGRPVVAADDHGDTLAIQQWVQRIPLTGEDDLEEPVSLTDGQRDLLRRVKMMVAYPVADPDRPSRIAAVVTLDDRLPPGEHLDTVLRAVEYLRDQVRQKLFPKTRQRNQVS